MVIRKVGGGDAVNKMAENLGMDILKLPTKRSEPVKNIQNYVIYLYGKDGIGKTSFSAQFPNALHFFFEPSGDALSTYEVMPKSWAEFIDYIELLESEKAKGTLKFETVIIDVIDICFKMCIEHVCEPLGVNWPPSDYGKTWNQVSEEFRKAMFRIKCVTGLAFVSHMTERNVERMDGQKYDTIVPTITNTGNQVLSKFCGLKACYMMNTSGQRILVIEPNNLCEAKNRISGHFLYTSGKKINEIPMGNSETEAWKNFNLAYNNKLVEPKAEIKNTSPEGITRSQTNKPQTSNTVVRRSK